MSIRGPTPGHRTPPLQLHLGGLDVCRCCWFFFREKAPRKQGAPSNGNPPSSAKELQGAPPGAPFRTGDRERQSALTAHVFKRRRSPLGALFERAYLEEYQAQGGAPPLGVSLSRLPPFHLSGGGGSREAYCPSLPLLGLREVWVFGAWGIQDEEEELLGKPRPRRPSGSSPVLSDWRCGSPTFFFFIF